MQKAKQLHPDVQGQLGARNSAFLQLLTAYQVGYRALILQVCGKLLPTAYAHQPVESRRDMGYYAGAIG